MIHVSNYDIFYNVTKWKLFDFNAIIVYFSPMFRSFWC